MLKNILGTAPRCAGALCLRSQTAAVRHVSPLLTTATTSAFLRPFSASRAAFDAAGDKPSSTPTATDATPYRNTDTPADAPGWVHMMNEALTRYPLTTVASFVALDAGSIISISALYTTLGLAIPADFALAFALSRLFRRVRLPLDLGAAALLAKVYPPLTMVKASALAGGLTGANKQQDGQTQGQQGSGSAAAAGAVDNSSAGPMPSTGAASASSSSPAAGPAATASTDGSTSTTATGATATTSTTPSPSIFGRAGAVLSSAIDKYGLALMIAQRTFVGLTSVFSIYFALRAGVDVQALLQRWEGASAVLTVGGMAATWAAAAVTVAPIFPLLLLGSGWMGIRLGRVVAARRAAMA